MSFTEKSKQAVDKRKKRKKDLVLEGLRKHHVPLIACNNAGIDRSTYYRWKKENPEFAKAVLCAQEEGRELISDVGEAKLLARVQDGYFPAIKYLLDHNHPNYKPTSMGAPESLGLTAKEKKEIDDLFVRNSRQRKRPVSATEKSLQDDENQNANIQTVSVEPA